MPFFFFLSQLPTKHFTHPLFFYVFLCPDSLVSLLLSFFISSVFLCLSRTGLPAIATCLISFFSFFSRSLIAAPLSTDPPPTPKNSFSSIAGLPRMTPFLSYPSTTHAHDLFARPPTYLQRTPEQETTHALVAPRSITHTYPRFYPPRIALLFL